MTRILVTSLLLLASLQACARPTINQWDVHTTSVTNATYTGNPFDLVADVTFTHEASGETRTTQMYYAGSDRWAFRFNGSRTGDWTYASTSSDPDLDGLSGTITVSPNPNPAVRGFVSAVGNKWARQVDHDTYEAFVPQIIMYDEVDDFFNHPSKVSNDAELFLIEQGFTGFVTQVGPRWFDLGAANASQVSNSDPDVETFEALELLISGVRAAGGIVHIWMWGDAQDSAGDQTQSSWGINGAVDQRLQRYIAARLGPMPGWTISYGYDLDEWVTEEEIDAWYRFMDSHWGWPHLAMARSHGPNKGMNHHGYVYAESLPVISYEHHRPDYEAYRAAVKHRPEKPVISEDRFRIRQSDGYAYKDYSEEMTRRGLWHSMMAGGVANVWGRQEDRSNTELGYPYENAHWMRTHFDFFEGRLELDYVPDNSLTDGYGLRSGDTGYIFYKEDAASVAIDLTGAGTIRTAVAVDATAPYAEIDVSESLAAGPNTLTAPSKSDWGIYIETSEPLPRTPEQESAASAVCTDGVPDDGSPIRPATDLVYYLMLDDFSGQHVQDVHGNNEFVEKGTFEYPPGMHGYSWQFDAAGDYLMLSDRSDISIAGTEASWVFWAKPDVSGNSMRVVSKHVPGAGEENYDYAVYISSSNSAVPLSWRPWFGDGLSRSFIADGPRVIDGAWQMVAVTVDPAANEVRTSVNAGPPVIDALPFDPVNDPDADLRIGDAGIADPYAGILDEFMFAKRVLSPVEIEWLYNDGTGRNYYEVLEGCGG